MLLALHALITAAPAEALEVDAVARVVRVVDGDTLRVVILEDLPDPPDLREGYEYRVRLADINAPEIDTREGLEAKEALEKVSPPGAIIYLDVDDIYVYDKYGRLVAVVLVEAGEGSLINVNKWLLDEGYATPWDHPNEFDPSKWTVTVAKNLAPAVGEAGEGEPGLGPVAAALVAAAVIIAVAVIARRLLR